MNMASSLRLKKIVIFVFLLWKKIKFSSLCCHQFPQFNYSTEKFFRSCRITDCSIVKLVLLFSNARLKEHLLQMLIFHQEFIAFILNFSTIFLIYFDMFDENFIKMWLKIFLVKKKNLLKKLTSLKKNVSIFYSVKRSKNIFSFFNLLVSKLYFWLFI